MMEEMTREEAENHLKTVAKTAIDAGYDSAVVDAVAMAIEAMEHDPSTMLFDIYMAGVNMTEPYQGVWVRYRDIEQIVTKYMPRREKMSSKMITHPVKFRKTCREYLPELMGRHIKLGFDKGSSFVFCKVVDADTEQELERIQDEIRNHIIHRGMKAALEHKILLDTGFEKWYQAERDKAKKKYDSYKTHIKPWEEPNPVKMAQKYEVKLKYCEKAVDRSHKYEGMPDFLLGALVSEQYPSIDPECRGTLIILLAGDAVGGYWTETEYLSGRPEYNDDEDDDEKGGTEC